MASRARDTHLQLGIRHTLVCFLGIIRPIEAQSGIPSVVSSAAPEAQTTLPPGELKGTFIYTDGYTVPVSCGPGESFVYSSTYAACCASGVQCDFAVGCDGSVLLFNGKPHSTCGGEYPDCRGTTIFDKFPYPITHWVDWVCTSSYEALRTIYQEVDPKAVASVSSSYYNRFSSDSQDHTTVEITQHVTVIISSGTYTSIVTQPRPVSSSDISPDTESTTGPVSSSSESEDNSSTTTRDSAPTPSTTFYGNPVPETHARPSSSRAWIAGAVAGPLFALVAVGGLLYWLKRHRQRKTLAENGGLGPGIHSHDPPCIQADFEPSAELSGKTSDPPPVCELEATEMHQGPFQGTGGAMRL